MKDGENYNIQCLWKYIFVLLSSVRKCYIS